MRSPGVGAQISGDRVTNTTTTTFTGGPWTFTRTAVASSAETIATFKVSDDATSKIEIMNNSASDAVFAPMIKGTVLSTVTGLQIWSWLTSDAGSQPGMLYRVETAAQNALTVRPLYQWNNSGTVALQMLPLNSGANSCLSWGTQTASDPAFTTRAAGTRIVLYSNIGAAVMDYAIGISNAAPVGPWIATATATSSHGIKFFGGTTQLALLRGDGVLSLGTNTTLYSRLGQKLETNTSANYGGAALNTWSATAAEQSLLDFNRSKSATVGTQTIVASGDALGAISFRGSDGAAFVSAVTITAAVDGTPGASDMPGRLMFNTTADGASSPTERMRITSAGDVGVGKTPTTGIILDVNGQLGLKSYTVATLPSAAVQAGAIVYASDAGGNGPCLAISNGTNWKRCDNTSTTVV